VLTLKEELDHIRDYLTIQQYRYPDILSFDISMPLELGSASVPPLTLQPFVENAIIHGYQKKTKSFRILITCGTEQTADGVKLVVVTLEDNGIGVEPAKLAALRQNVSDVSRAAGESRHLGIWNVYRRLSLMFGERQASIDFEPVDTGGLRVMVRFPYKTA